MRPHVLVVDNEQEMVKLLQRHLEREGFAVSAVTTGGDAVAALGREEYDVVLTDLVMDEVDGLAVLREAQRLQPKARVILMTAFASLETAIAAYERRIDPGASRCGRPLEVPDLALDVGRHVLVRRVGQLGTELTGSLTDTRVAATHRLAVDQDHVVRVVGADVALDVTRLRAPEVVVEHLARRPHDFAVPNAARN